MSNLCFYESLVLAGCIASINIAKSRSVFYLLVRQRIESYGPAVANKNAVAKRKFITAFFDDAEKRAVYLLDLHANGRATEAATLWKNFATKLRSTSLVQSIPFLKRATF
jgi:hypothetical protein